MALRPRIGERLPSFDLDCSRPALLRWAAGSGDFYPLHHDPDAPESRAAGHLVVPGRYKHAALGRLVSEWLRHRGRVRRLRCRYVAVDPVGGRLVCSGRVTGVRRGTAGTSVDLRLWVEDSAGRPTTIGDAEVDWFGPVPVEAA